VLSPEGFNVGGVNPWFARAVERAARYSIGEGETVRAVTPPYFLATKLVAFADRGPDADSSKDAEDIVALAVEVPSLLDDVQAEGLHADVATLWDRVLAKYALARSDLPDLVDWHLHPRDAEHRDRVIATLARLAEPA
jgi:predicted nucleotidyltransferase